MPLRYELIEHTADIGIKAYGKKLEELFVNAACGMFEIMADLENIQPKQTCRLNLEAPNIEELFLSWLSELLYQYNSKEIIFKQFSIDSLTKTTISARAQGEKLNLRRHRLKLEIKAVTFHELKVRRVKDGWRAEVIFDV